MKKILGGKKGSNDEFIAEAKGYFEELEQSYCKEGIQKLGQHWTKYIKLKGDIEK